MYMAFRPYKKNISVGDLVYFCLDVDRILAIGIVTKKTNSSKKLDEFTYVVYWSDTKDTVSYKRYMINKFI